MRVRKQSKGAKVIRKHPHGDSGQSVGMKGTSNRVSNKSVYKGNGNRRILFPVARTQTNPKILSAAVDIVVAEQKK